jgi:hypothetical protein
VKGRVTTGRDESGLQQNEEGVTDSLPPRPSVVVVYESGWSRAWNWLFGRTNVEIVGDDIAGVHQRLQNGRAGRFEGVQDPEVESSRLEATARGRAHTFSGQAKVGEDVDGFINDAGREIVYEAVGTGLAAGVFAAFRRGAPAVNKAIDASADGAVDAARVARQVDLTTVLEVAGVPRGFPASVKAQAHHIVPKSDWKGPIAEKLESFGIYRDSVENGMWLPAEHFEGRTHALHRGRHTPGYSTAVLETLAKASNREEALEALLDLRKRLEEGTLQPHYARVTDRILEAFKNSIGL